MKFQGFGLLMVTFLTTIAMAQNESTTTFSNEGSISARGLRLGIVKSILDMNIKGSKNGSSASNQDKLDDSLGLSLGYVNLPVQQLGWTSNLTYLNIKEEGSNANLMRVDGNLAYAFTNTLNLKGGLNLAKFTSTDGGWAQNMDAAIGFQASLGVQITENFGLDVGFTQMNQSGSLGDISVNLRESGTELGLTATF